MNQRDLVKQESFKDLRNTLCLIWDDKGLYRVTGRINKARALP